MNLDESVFIIAEIGINHNGNVELGKKLVDACVFAGADCAKFQMRNLKELYRNNETYKDEDLSSQYVLDLLNKFNLENEALFELFDYAKSQDILPLCTPWDMSSFRALEEYGIWGYKTASADLTNHELLKEIGLTNKPVFVSTGMSTEEEITETAYLLKRTKADFTFLHCNSTYPTPFKDVNLNYLFKLEKISGRPVGYSGHERGISVAIAAVAKGARVIEKHITISKDMEGNDHKVSLLPKEFANMVRGIREVEQSLGNSNSRACSSGELINRESLSKSIVSSVHIRAGDIIERELLDIKSPGRGLQPNSLPCVIGKVAKRDIPKGHFLYECDIRDVISPRNYEIPYKWGIPARFHDYEFFLRNTNAKLIEFHLSYNDLSIDIDNVFRDSLHTVDLVVHSPDVFEGDHLIDLSSPDSDYRNESIKNLRRVIDITKKLRPHFKTKGRTTVIVSVGGATRNSTMSHKQKRDGYARVAESLKQVEDDETEVVIQTLPPFPWYFGGQLFLNLFVVPEEISSFCSSYKRRICLDTSHSQLACNYHKSNFIDFLEEVNPHIKHLHIADACGVDQEGLQIGSGDVDFRTLFRTMDSDVTFIPEIWQGHKNLGEECWKALTKIEEILKT